MDLELDVPEEVQELFLYYFVSLQCRDEAIKSVFKAKRAIYYGKEAEKARLCAWEKIHALYLMHADNPGLTYNKASRKLIVKTEKS